MKAITDFLRSRPAISARAIEREAGIPLNTLSNALSKSVSRPIPPEWVWPLCVTLSRYGFEVDGCRLFYIEDVYSFIAHFETDDEPQRWLIDSPDELEDFLRKKSEIV